MITHVIVELDRPIEDKYWKQVDYSDEYYGVGTPLVRCKDCKWYELDKKLHCCLPYGTRLPDDYCSLAERKEE